MGRVPQTFFSWQHPSAGGARMTVACAPTKPISMNVLLYQGLSTNPSQINHWFEYSWVPVQSRACVLVCNYILSLPEPSLPSWMLLVDVEIWILASGFWYLDQFQHVRKFRKLPGAKSFIYFPNLVMVCCHGSHSLVVEWLAEGTGHDHRLLNGTDT